jgi:hypothetical protein
MHSTAAAVAGGDSGYWHLMEFQLEITIVSIAAAAAAAQLIMWRHTKSLGQVEIMARAQIEAKPEQ